MYVNVKGLYDRMNGIITSVMDNIFQQSFFKFILMSGINSEVSQRGALSYLIVKGIFQVKTKILSLNSQFAEIFKSAGEKPSVIFNNLYLKHLLYIN